MGDKIHQIQAICKQIQNIKIEIDNISDEYCANMHINHNMELLYSTDKKIHWKLINLGTKLLYTGIKALEIGNSEFKNLYYFINQLKFISSFVSCSDKMIEQQIMQEQMLKKQKEQQETMQSQLQLMQKRQMIEPKFNFNFPMNNKEFIFKTMNGKQTKIALSFETTVGGLLKSYMLKEYGKINEKIIFIHNGAKLQMDDQREITNIFPKNNNIIIVLEN